MLMFFFFNLGIGIGGGSEPLPFLCFSDRGRRYSWMSVFLPPSSPDPSDLWGIQDEFGAGEAVCLQCARLLPGECVCVGRGGRGSGLQGAHLPSYREATLPWRSCLPLAVCSSSPRHPQSPAHCHQHHHHLPLGMGHLPSQPRNSVLAISTYNFPLEVSQPHPARQMFRTVISDRGAEGACFDKSHLNPRPLDCW